MAFIDITLYATQVADGIVTGDSTQVTLTIDDLDDDGAISTAEWQNYTNDPYGHLAGETNPPALFEGDGTGNVLYGTLYSPVAYSTGDNVTTLLKDLEKGGGDKYNPAIADLNICFLAGTMIATPSGEVPVETLRAGDLVLTRDHGAMPLVWTSQSTVTEAHLDLAPNQRPIRIKAGALGGDLPRRDVDVSPQHRVLVSGADGDEYLISARHLMMAGLPGVALRPVNGDFTLVHVACADHEVIIAEGAPMETLFTGPMAVRALGLPQRLGLIATFPTLARSENPMTPARPFIKHRDYARMMAEAPSRR